jgi:hypothetical protein
MYSHSFFDVFYTTIVGTILNKCTLRMALAITQLQLNTFIITITEIGEEIV